MDWNRIVDEMADRMFLYARQSVQDETAAADIVQEAFIRLWRQHDVKPMAEPDLPAYCFATVRRIAYDYLRSSQRRAARELKAGEWLYEPGALFASTLEQEEERAALELALDGLPVEQREVVTLKIWGNLTFKEVALAVGASQNTVMSRYRLALTKLRQTFEGGPQHDK